MFNSLKIIFLISICPFGAATYLNRLCLILVHSYMKLCKEFLHFYVPRAHFPSGIWDSNLCVCMWLSKQIWVPLWLGEYNFPAGKTQHRARSVAGVSKILATGSNVMLLRLCFYTKKQKKDTQSFPAMYASWGSAGKDTQNNHVQVSNFS